MALTLDEIEKILEYNEKEDNTKGDKIEPLDEDDERILDECWRELAKKRQLNDD